MTPNQPSHAHASVQSSSKASSLALQVPGMRLLLFVSATKTSFQCSSESSSWPFLSNFRLRSRNNIVSFSLELLQHATQLCAAVGGTPVDNAIAISTLATQPNAAALYSSFAAVNLASSKVAIASSAAIANSLDIAIGSAAAASVLRTLNATSMPTGTIGSTHVTGTGAAPFAVFTGGAMGRGLGMAGGLHHFVALGAALCLSI